MKNQYVFVVAILLLGSFLVQCKSKTDLQPERERIDFNKGGIQLMDTLVPKIHGKWNLSQVEFKIRYQPATGSVKKDTIFKNFATLEITNISRSEDQRYPLCDGRLVLDGKVWNMQFRLWPAAERVAEQTGPQAFTLFEWHFPTGTHVWQEDELFFRDLQLAGENYAIHYDYRNNTMIWKGLNRDVKEIKLVKMQ